MSRFRNAALKPRTCALISLSAVFLVAVFSPLLGPMWWIFVLCGLLLGAISAAIWISAVRAAPTGIAEASTIKEFHQLLVQSRAGAAYRIWNWAVVIFICALAATIARPLFLEATAVGCAASTAISFLVQYLTLSGRRSDSTE